MVGWLKAGGEKGIAEAQGMAVGKRNRETVREKKGARSCLNNPPRHIEK